MTSNNLSFKDQLIRSSSLPSKPLTSHRNSSTTSLTNGNGTFNNDIESENYDPLADIFQMFGHPNNLADLDDALSYTNVYKLQLESEIKEKNSNYLNNQQFVSSVSHDADTSMRTVEEGNENGNGKVETKQPKPKEKQQPNLPADPLVRVDTELTQLIDQFNITETLAKSTGKTINDMTSNIKKLDNCKKNLTLSMTILKRLQMLIISYDSLTDLTMDEIEIKNYKKIKEMLSVVLELMMHFQTYKIDI
ncbi:unnamed protein product [Ambrosiozyma monospora]|uniref:Unnamed protein product n=1 Tax=Ambrosiozyma monospora TaxID=43982 RepID=A0ACB5T2Q7_AMBMO|nr:unnamed protein product [Ambrosiozyma monospora]